MARPQKLTAEQDAAIARVRDATASVRRLEASLADANLERRAAMMAASEAGITTYRIAQEADTSHASAWRMINEYDEKWRAAFQARLERPADG